MKVTVVKAPPVVQPPTIVIIELELEQAQELLSLLDQIGVGKDNKIYGPECCKLTEQERIDDKFYAGHTWYYKRLIDALAYELKGEIEHLPRLGLSPQE